MLFHDLLFNHLLSYASQEQINKMQPVEFGSVREKSEMSILKWTQDFSVGMESLDTDHKLLIGFINQLDMAITRGDPHHEVRSVLDALLDYTDYHFNREEALMKACGYPDFDAHAQSHQIMRHQVADIRERFVRNPDAIHPREILAFLKNWLTSHVVGRDKLYAPFMKSRIDAVNSANEDFGDTVPSPSDNLVSG